MAVKKKTPTTKKKAPPKRIYDPAAAQVRLKKAALELFAAQGFKATTTREIATKAQANVCLIDRYFHGKEGLLDALMLEYVEDRKNEVLNYPLQLTLKDEIVEYLLFMTQQTKKNILYTRLIYSHSLTHPDNFTKKINGNSKRTGDHRLLERLRELQAQGICPAQIDVEEVNMMVTTFLIGILTSTYIIFPNVKIDMKNHIISMCKFLNFQV